MSEVVCPSCGTQTEYGAVFCDECGYNLSSVPPAAPPAAPPQAPPSSAAGGIRCANCGTENAAGSAFCESCGFQLSGQVPQPVAPPAVPVAPPAVTPPVPAVPPPSPLPAAAASPVAGRFVVQPANTSLQIPPGKTEVVLGREDPASGIFPEIDLDPHGGQDSGVGRQHCKLVAQGGQVYVEDMSSVNGSFLNKQKLVPGQRMPINNGDELRLGKIVLIYYSS